jgi:hypothetical protein
VADGAFASSEPHILDGAAAFASPITLFSYRTFLASTIGALAGGIEAAQGKYVIIGDSDGSYDFSALFPFVEKFRTGYDLVVGNRFQGRIAPGAMPALHRYFGNPFLTAVGRLFFLAGSVAISTPACAVFETTRCKR